MASQSNVTLYAYSTYTAPRVLITLEEIGIPYNVVNVNIEAHDNHHPEYKKNISITGQVPALVDKSTSLRLTESATIMFYLIDKYGAHLSFEKGNNEYYELIQFMDFITDLSLMVGFGRLIYDSTPGIEAAMKWRVSMNLTVLNDHLKEQKEKHPESEGWLEGGKFSAADITAYATVLSVKTHTHIDIEELGLEELVAWKERIG